MEETEKFKHNKFTGKRSDFSLWRERFLAQCTMKDCEEVVTTDNLVPKDSDVLDPKDCMM